jgi:hypothetical protein
MSDIMWGVFNSGGHLLRGTVRPTRAQSISAVAGEIGSSLYDTTREKEWRQLRERYGCTCRRVTVIECEEGDSRG